MAMIADVIPLPYAPAVARWRRRRVRRAVLLVLLFALGIAGSVWGPDAAGRAYRLYLQRRCLAYEGSAARVVYDEDNSALRAWSLGGDRSAPPPKVAITATPMPAAWVDLRSRVLIGTPAQSGQYINGTAPRACVFLHERGTPDGERRLLAVELLSDARAGVPHLVTHAVRPSGWSKLPAATDVETDGGYVCSLGEVPGRKVSFGPGGWRHLRAFEGRPDPADASRFVIPFELDGVRAYVHGRVVDKYWAVEWTVKAAE
ncbi:MAG TPA: hypothetical protein VEA69_26130 [Tepidisphaeraceae bacterium]|nr:hypothetical protein [Tepidisphaeraceae bacterium]